MHQDQGLGLDELMIVNPGPSGTHGLFLGEDGAFYQMQGSGEHEAQGIGRFFLGEDGTLYQVQGFGAGGVAESAESLGASLPEEQGRELGRYFLGADGALYEVVR